MLTITIGTDEEGKQIATLIRKLVKEGNNGTATYKDPVASVSKSGNMVLQDNYYIQNYKVSSNVQITTYDVATTKFPKGTKITNTNGVEKSTFNAGEVFQIRLPKEAVETSDISGRIRIDVNTKSYAIFYGKTYDETLQNYAVTGDPISMRSSSVDLNLKGNTASIKIKKVDKDTNEGIEGTIYELTGSDGKIIGTGKTDENGNLTFNNLYQDNYILKEIKSNDNYVISQESIDIRATYNKVTEVTLTNEHKKGNLKIYKVDKDNNNIGLGNVEFDLYSEEFGKIIDTYRTDANGELLIENLRIGNYKLIEKNTNKWYELGEDIEIKIDWNNTTEIKIENELKKGQIKVIKVDADNNEIKLKGVKFEVLDKLGNVLETIVTNENGEAYTSKYAIRDYNSITIREVETLENYVLNDEPQTIILEEGKVKDVTFENSKLYGKIKINKFSSSYSEILDLPANSPLANTKFLVVDADGNVMGIYTTDENGSVLTEDLPYGEYTVYEYETPEHFLKDAKPQTVSITEDNQVVELTFKNSPEQPKLPKTGF